MGKRLSSNFIIILCWGDISKILMVVVVVGALT